MSVSVLAVAVIARCQFQGTSFPARITEVSATRVCADIGDKVLYGKDAPKTGQDLCADPERFVFDKSPPDLHVGDCVMMSNHHPGVAADKRVNSAACEGLDQ